MYYGSVTSFFVRVVGMYLILFMKSESVSKCNADVDIYNDYAKTDI